MGLPPAHRGPVRRAKVITYAAVIGFDGLSYRHALDEDVRPPTEGPLAANTPLGVDLHAPVDIIDGLVCQLRQDAVERERLLRCIASLGHYFRLMSELYCSTIAESVGLLTGEVGSGK